jgi:hypothetical protein
VVRPSAASLNSLAEVLRKAKPLYSECRFILNYLDESGEDGFSMSDTDAHGLENRNPANNNAASTPLAVFELGTRYGKRLV